MNYQYSTYFFAAISVVLLSVVISGYQPKSHDNDTQIHKETMHMNHSMSMHSMMMNMTSRMEGKTGDELDRIFLEDMIVHHQGALDMTEVLLEKTERPELQTLAADIIIAQTAEIIQMEAWLEKWFQ